MVEVLNNVLKNMKHFLMSHCTIFYLWPIARAIRDHSVFGVIYAITYFMHYFSYYIKKQKFYWESITPY